MAAAKAQLASNADQLYPELAGVAVEEAVVAVGVDSGSRKQAGGQGAPGAADAVHPEGVQGIVIAQLRLHDS